MDDRTEKRKAGAANLGRLRPDAQTVSVVPQLGQRPCEDPCHNGVNTGRPTWASANFGGRKP